MKIQCQSCQAKYTIADEKVVGKVVKIRCKKCSSTIVINGNDQAASGGDAGGDANAFDYAGASGDAWTVNVADGDQRTMTVGEIAAEYKSGVINDETYCWKDGMADWLPLREINEIYASVKSGGASVVAENLMSVSPAQSVPPPAAAANLFAAPAPAAADAFAGSVTPKTAGNGNGTAGGLFGGASAATAEAAPAAARRAGGRGQGGDLFGNVEKAGGEDDVMTSAQNAAVAANVAKAAEAPPPAAHDDKLTGQRNENSVLFSLSALTDKKPEGSSSSSSSSGNGNRTTATSDGSGLIDIRALSANMDEEGAKKKDKGARVDDIMNLSGGGAFGAALAAPILAPPPLDPIDLGVSAPQEQPKQSKTLVFAILGGCALIAIGIVAAVFLTRPPADGSKTASPTGSNSATPDTSSSVAMATPAPTDSSAMAGNAGSNNNTPAPPATGDSKAPTGVHVASGGGGGHTAGHPAGGGGTTPAAGGGDTTPPPAAAPTKAPDFSAAMAAAAGQPAAPAAPAGGGGSTASFDKGSAAGSLGKVDVQGCKKSDGPTGPGHVTVTFQNDGNVQSAVVDQGPYPGTPVGGCVAGRFKGAHVPAFAGAPVRVGKSFIIN